MSTLPPAPEGSIAAEQAPIAPRRKTAVRRAVAGGLLMTGLLLLKLKSVVLLVGAKVKPFMANPFEGFGLAQFAVTAGSMAVSLLAYAAKMGWAFAAGFLVLLVVHEVGHAATIRARGLRAGAMVFIPFIGGAVTLRHQPRSAYVDAQIGLGGPIAGTLASVASLFLYYGTNQPLYLALAFAGFLINLFNLTPIAPLDGGRIAAAITKWMWILGAAILGFFLVRWRNPLLLPIFILGVWQIWRSIAEERRRRFYEVPLARRALIAAVYFSLVFFLAWQSVLAHRELEAVRALTN